MLRDEGGCPKVQAARHVCVGRIKFGERRGATLQRFLLACRAKGTRGQGSSIHFKIILNNSHFPGSGLGAGNAKKHNMA